MMNNRTYILVLVLTGVVLSSADEKKRPRVFSLFSIVQFKQDECTTVAAPSVKGTCMTSTECASIGGTADGNCASAFGVCCLIRLSTCGSTVTRNCSYIENPSYTSGSTYTTSSAGDCSFTVNACQEDICNIRLDFTDVSLQQPAAAGTCTNTILDITPGSTTSPVSVGQDPPTVCGTLTGQHMYLETSRATTAATLKFTFTAGSVNRWRIKVSQIECYSNTRPPFGCLQYFYGADRHTISSFNWDGTNSKSTGGLIRSQMYHSCVRAEKGRCGIAYSTTPVSTSLSAFELEEAAPSVSEIGTDCANAFVSFVMAEDSAGDKICGGVFCALDACADEVANSVVHGQGEAAFKLLTYVDNETTASNAGFSLDAQLQGCASSYANAQ